MRYKCLGTAIVMKPHLTLFIFIYQPFSLENMPFSEEIMIQNYVYNMCEQIKILKIKKIFDY